MHRPTLAAIGTAAALATATLIGAPAAQAHPTYHHYGKTWASNQVLRGGCHHYHYSYKITAPTPYWAAEIFLVNPHHAGLTSAAIDSSYDPVRGRRSWTICRDSTVTGKYKMKMKVTYCTDEQCSDTKPPSGYVKPTTFYLTKPHRHRR